MSSVTSAHSKFRDSAISLDSQGMPDSMYPRLNLPDMTGRKVVITGPARGLGREQAIQYTLAGADVIGIGLSDHGELAKTERLVNALRSKQSKGRVNWFEVDVTDRDALSHIGESMLFLTGGMIDILVLNAGVAAPFSMVHDEPDALLKMINVNIIGIQNVVREFGSFVTDAKGKFVYLASMAAKMPLPLMGAYGGTKAFIENMAKAQRLELAHTGATVLIVFLNPISSDMTTHGQQAAAAQGIKNVIRPVPARKTISTIIWAVAGNYREVYVPKLMRTVPFMEQPAQRVVGTIITATGKARQAVKNHLSDPNRNEVSTPQQEKEMTKL